LTASIVPGDAYETLMAKFCATLLFLVVAVGPAPAQSNFFDRWEARTSATQAKQPAWSPPLATPFVSLIQVFRGDFGRQTNASRADTWNYGSGKGLSLIPWARTEFDFNLPPLLTHSSPKTIDGTGDVSLSAKYRLLAGNARHGNYAICAFVTGSIPTGSYKNGSTDAAVAPGMGFGKGFGGLNIQSTLSATLPTGDTPKLGRPVAWNTTAQYHFARYFWPEVEMNATWFKGGANDGKMQNFATPGIMFGRIPLRPNNEKSRLGLGVGGGMQIATSHFHTYNHGLIFSGRLLF
jgi:hypothetical protein